MGYLIFTLHLISYLRNPFIMHFSKVYDVGNPKRDFVRTVE